MKPRLGQSAVTLFALALMLGLEGCISNAPYQYAQQPDSATVCGTDVSMVPLGKIDQTSFAKVLMIDGHVVATVSALSEVPASPGRHEIDVQSFGGDLTSYYLVDASRTVRVELAANHRYRFAGSGGYGLVLWDETTGVDKRTQVGVWAIGSGPLVEDDNEVPIEPVDLNGAHFARPPFDHDDKPSHPGSSGDGDQHGTPTHSGGPPSIPHNPPPSRGGGGSSGHSSGGGSSGHSGGGSSGGGGGSGKKH